MLPVDVSAASRDSGVAQGPQNPAAQTPGPTRTSSSRSRSQSPRRRRDRRSRSSSTSSQSRSRTSQSRSQSRSRSRSGDRNRKRRRRHRSRSRSRDRRRRRHRRSRSRSSSGSRSRSRSRSPQPVAGVAIVPGVLAGSAAATDFANMCMQVGAAAMGVPAPQLPVAVPRKEKHDPPPPPSGPSAASVAQGKSKMYKTELCKTWTRSQTCPYGEKCQYAHGYDELRESPKVRHIKHGTQQCMWELHHGSCKYGNRCIFLHSSRPNEHFGLITRDQAAATSAAPPRPLIMGKDMSIPAMLGSFAPP